MTFILDYPLMNASISVPSLVVMVAMVTPPVRVWPEIQSIKLGRASRHCEEQSDEAI
jgi:hypothetical protein